MSPCKCRTACGPHFGAARAARGGEGGVHLRRPWRAARRGMPRRARASTRQSRDAARLRAVRGGKGYPLRGGSTRRGSRKPEASMGCGGIPRAAMPLGDGSRRSRGDCTSRHAATQPACGLYGEARGIPLRGGSTRRGARKPEASISCQGEGRIPLHRVICNALHVTWARGFGSNFAVLASGARR